MNTSIRLRLLAGTVVLAIGMVDAALSSEWDLFALFVLATIVVASTVLGWRRERESLTVRADLVRWVRRNAEATGEPIDDAVDRVLASARHGLFAQPDDDG